MLSLRSAPYVPLPVSNFPGAASPFSSSAIPVLGLFAVALLVRLAGVDFGYFLGDERINEGAKVLTGQLVPTEHYYPPLMNYLNAAAFVILFGVGLVLQFWDSLDGFRAQYFEDPTAFYIAARTVTALTGAALAPLFYLILRALDMPRRAAQVGGLIAALFPLAVFLSHIAKGDVALASSVIACVWAVVERHRTDRPVYWDIGLGVAVVLAVSFKHSAVFLLAPMMLGHAISLALATSLGAMLRSAGMAVLTVVLLWPVLNIGIVLDLQNFLEYQRIQSVMSVRDDGLGPALAMMAAQTVDVALGVNPVLAILGALFPAYLLSPFCQLPRRGLLAGLWAAMLTGTLIVASMVGTRQPEHLWIANFAMLLLFATLIVADLVRQAGHGPTPSAGWGLAAVVLALGVWGSNIVLGQALAAPYTGQVDILLADRFADRKIVTSGFHTRLPQHRKAQQAEFARWDRLAKKYNSAMPEMAPERIIRVSAPGAIYYRNMPTALYGLENVSDDNANYQVKAHAWPLQHEEWQLDYWLDRGFEVFVVGDLQHQMANSGVGTIRDFYRDLDSRCETVQAFLARKQLFQEWPVTVLRCG